MSDGLVLTGLDGSNPLGFLAAVGLLRWLTEEHDASGVVTLRWRDEGVWRPVIGGVDDLEAVIERLAADAPTWLQSSALGLSYDKKGATTYDLKPPPAEYRGWLQARLAEREHTRGSDFAAAYGVAEALDNNGNVKPTALHFTAGNQIFLDMVRTLAESVTADDFREALLGPWRHERRTPSLSWDATVSRSYALRASDPSKEKRTGIPGADWLAFHALPLLPVASERGRLRTACTGGGWKDGRMRWPVWTAEAPLPSVRALLVTRDVERWTAAQREARGIGQVFACDIRRSDQGGYGSFDPARVASREDRVGR